MDANNNKKPAPGGNGDKDSGGKRPTGQNIINIVLVALVLVIITQFVSNARTAASRTNTTYNTFISWVDEGQVEKVVLQDGYIYITLNDSEGEIYYTGQVDDPDLTQRLLAAGVEYSQETTAENTFLNTIFSIIIWVVVIYLCYSIFFRFMAKRMGDSGGGFGGMMSVGKSKAKVYNMEENTGVTFKDVAGQDEAKESLDEIVDFLHYPQKYKNIGAKQPRGALLVGPPGTGKTLIAKAVAGEAGVPFYSLSGSEFVEMFVGVGASRVRDLFQEAAKHSPCIIFIDEIDAIGKSRDSHLGGNDEREQTLNQLLSEMDGFDGSKGIVILAATNRPEILDKALLRPGRFDRRIVVEKPDLPGREAILKVHASKVLIGENVNLHDIALSTSGATGADLANMVNEAALRAVRMGRHFVMQEDLVESVELVIAGKEKKDRILNETEKRMVAYHEVGHALASALQKNAQPVQKITIVPRTMGSLGYTMNMPEEERYLLTKEELKSQIVMLLAGRAAEEIIFNTSSTGAANDIERATQMARKMVTQYGMSDTFDMMNLESTQSQYLDGRNVLTVSEATGAEIDREVRELIKECHEEAAVLLLKSREKLVEIAEFLILKETITGDQFMAILKPPALEPPVMEDVLPPAEEPPVMEDVLLPAEEHPTVEDVLPPPEGSPAVS